MPKSTSAAMLRAPGPKPLPIPELIPLIEAAQAGDVKARNRVVETNMRLVTKIAQRLAAQAGMQADLPDLVQAAVAGPRGDGGLIHAIARFDTKRGRRFSTYATYWIRLAVRDAISELRDDDVLGGARERANRVRLVKTKLYAELGHAPTEREIKARCVLLGFEAPSDAVLNRISAGKRRADASDPDEVAHDPETEEMLELKQLFERARELMPKLLTEQEIAVLSLTYGLFGLLPHSSAQIAEIIGVPAHKRSKKHGYGVTRIETEALAKLRGAMLEEHGSARSYPST